MMLFPEFKKKTIFVYVQVYLVYYKFSYTAKFLFEQRHCAVILRVRFCTVAELVAKS